MITFNEIRNDDNIIMSKNLENQYDTSKINNGSNINFCYLYKVPFYDESASSYTNEVGWLCPISGSAEGAAAVGDRVYYEDVINNTGRVQNFWNGEEMKQVIGVTLSKNGSSAYWSNVSYANNAYMMRLDMEDYTTRTVEKTWNSGDIRYYTRNGEINLDDIDNVTVNDGNNELVKISVGEIFDYGTKSGNVVSMYPFTEYSDAYTYTKTGSNGQDYTVVGAYLSNMNRIVACNTTNLGPNDSYNKANYDSLAIKFGVDGTSYALSYVVTMSPIYVDPNDLSFTDKITNNNSYAIYKGDFNGHKSDLYVDAGEYTTQTASANCLYYSGLAHEFEIPAPEGYSFDENNINLTSSVDDSRFDGWWSVSTPQVVDGKLKFTISCNTFTLNVFKNLYDWHYITVNFNVKVGNRSGRLSGNLSLIKIGPYVAMP